MRGRPREVDALRKMLRVRATDEQFEAWKLAALAEGTNMSDVARELLDEWSERVLSGESP